jgi:hypothetical protein
LQLLLLSVGSLVFAMYGVLFKLVFDDLRGPPTNCSDRRTPRVRTMRAFGFRVSWTRTPRARTQSAMSRAWRDLGVLLAPFGAALILGHSAHLTASISAWIGLALCLVVLAINDAHARTIGRPHSSVLASLLEPRAYRGARRLVIIAGAVALGVTYGSAGALTIIGTIVMVYLLDRFLPVVDPVDQSGDVVPGGGTSRWLRAVSILAATGLTVIGFLSALPAIIRASNLDAKVASVRAGHRLTYGKLNPLAFAEPRAEPVRVRWVAQNPPDPFTSGRSRSLTYFGQNSGTAVFLDLHVSPTAIYRLPVSALAIESVSPASRP